MVFQINYWVFQGIMFWIWSSNWVCNYLCNNRHVKFVKLRLLWKWLGSSIVDLTPPFEKFRNGILLPKLFWPTVRRNCSSDRDFFEIRGSRPRICKNFEITRTICLNSERFFWSTNVHEVTECFFTLFLEVSQI